MKPIAALYARVSTSNQEEEETIVSQVGAIEDYVLEKGYELPVEHYFLDQAVSGARLDRPALDRLRNLAAEGVFSVVVCYSPDRLARQYVYQWVVLDELQRVGVRVDFVNQPDLGDNPQAQLLLGIQGLFAEYERAMVKERLRLGRLYKIRNGQLMHGAPPYGYRYIPVTEPNGGRWEINDTEAAVVRQVYDWYSGEDNLTIWQIVERLNQSYRHALRRAKQWRYSVVQQMLKRSAYVGLAYYNCTRSLPETVGARRTHWHGKRLAPQREKRPPEEWVQVRVPALIEEATWERAQERLVMNQKFAERNNKKNFYLLRGLLVCSTCGHTLQGRTIRDRVHYFCEYGSKKRYLTVPRHTCYVPGNVVEPLVWQAIADLLHNPQRIADAWGDEMKTQNTPDELARLQTRQRKLDRQWLRLVDAYQDGLLEINELEQRKSCLDQERHAISKRIKHVQHQQWRTDVKQQMIADFATYCQEIEAALTNPMPEIKQEVMRLLIDHVVVEDEAITIKHIIPTDDDCRLLPNRKLRRIQRLALSLFRRPALL